MPVSGMAADAITLHMHDGVGLTFEFHFTTKSGGDLVYSMAGETTANFTTTQLTADDVLDHVDVYIGGNISQVDHPVAGGTFYETIPASAILKNGATGSDTAHLIDDIGNNGKAGGTIVFNPGNINFWYQGEGNKTSIVLNAQKFVEGKDEEGHDVTTTDTAGFFNFKVYEFYNTAAQKVVATGTNAKDGSITFTPIKYSGAGSHIYTVEESPSGKMGWTTDTHTYTVTVKVTQRQPVGLAIVDATATYPGNGVSFTDTYKFIPGATSATLEAHKDVVGATLRDSQFNFGLYDKDGALIETASNDAAGAISFDPIEYDEAGTYNYTIKELSASGDGWASDTNVHDVQVDVTQSGNKLSAAVSYDGAATMPTFTNLYRQPRLTETSLGAKKLVEGADLVAGMFKFELVDEKGVALQTKSNDANGQITFDQIDYTELGPGAYTYTIREVIPDPQKPGWTYDETEYIAVVEVTEDNLGNLTASNRYYWADPTSEAGFNSNEPLDLADVVFINMYESVPPIHHGGGGSTKKVMSLSLLATGDTSSIALPCLVLTAAAAALVLDRKRKQA